MSLAKKHAVGAKDRISFDADVKGQLDNLTKNPHGNLDVTGGFDEDPILLAERLISGLPPEDHVVAASEEAMPRARGIQSLFARRRT